MAADEPTTTAAPVVVTATRFAASIDTAPVNITTITAQDIAQSNSTSLADVLAQQPGVSVSSLFGISGSKSKVDMGGFGSNSGQNTLLLLNGRRLNDVDLQGANLAAIPLDSIAQIEIIHGSGTVLYGDNAVSGVINIVTKNGFDGKHASVKMQVGSFQTQRLSGDLRGSSNGTALSFAFDGLKSNGYRDNSAFDTFSLMTEASREKAGNNYGARINASREKLELPGDLDEATFKSTPKAAGTGALESAKERRLAVEGFFVGDGLAGELTLSKKRQEATIFGDTVAELSTLSFTPRANRQYGKHSLVTGIDLYRSRLEADAEFANFAPPPASVINHSDTTRDSYAVYITDNIQISNTTLVNFGARHQRVNVKIKNNGNIAGTSKDSQNDNLNAADITLSRKHKYGAQNYIRLARSFRSPVLDEMWNYFSGSIGLLDPQTANHLEIGSRQALANSIKLNANLFRMNINDEIAFDGSANVNLDKTRRDGLNLGLSAALSPKLSINTGYAYRKASFRTGANKGNTVPLVPKHKLTLAGDYQLGNHQQLGMNVVHKGKRYFGNDNANIGKRLPGYTQVDVSFSQQFKSWKARILVKNLTNVKTADSGFYAGWLTPPYAYYPLPERAIYFTFEGEM